MTRKTEGIAAICAASLIALSAHAQLARNHPPRIATLGPPGTNHDLNVQRYIKAENLGNAEIVFVDDFLKAGDQLRRGEMDLIIVQPGHHQLTEMAQRYSGQIFLVDCFRGKTHEMALLTRDSVREPKSVAYFPVTAGYFDVSKYEKRTLVGSNIEAGERLVAGEFDSAFTFTNFATAHPGQYRIDKLIGARPVVWKVFSNRKTTPIEPACERGSPMRTLD